MSERGRGDGPPSPCPCLQAPCLDQIPSMRCGGGRVGVFAELADLSDQTSQARSFPFVGPARRADSRLRRGLHLDWRGLATSRGEARGLRRLGIGRVRRWRRRTVGGSLRVGAASGACEVYEAGNVGSGNPDGWFEGLDEVELGVGCLSEAGTSVELGLGDGLEAADSEFSTFACWRGSAAGSPGIRFAMAAGELGSAAGGSGLTSSSPGADGLPPKSGMPGPEATVSSTGVVRRGPYSPRGDEPSVGRSRRWSESPGVGRPARSGPGGRPASTWAARPID